MENEQELTMYTRAFRPDGSEKEGCNISTYKIIDNKKVMITKFYLPDGLPEGESFDND